MKVQQMEENVTLRGGTRVVIRTLRPSDAPALLGFFRGLPEEDRLYLRDDATRPGFVQEFIGKADFEVTIPLVAEKDGEIVGNGTLYRTRHGWTVHVAQIRVAVAASFQRKGLGSELAKRLVKIAMDLGVDKMIAQVADNQVAAKRAFEKLGFRQEAVLRGHVKDIFGKKRDLLILSNDVSHLWEAMESLTAQDMPNMDG